MGAWGYGLFQFDADLDIQDGGADKGAEGAGGKNSEEATGRDALRDKKTLKVWLLYSF